MPTLSVTWMGFDPNEYVWLVLRAVYTYPFFTDHLYPNLPLDRYKNASIHRCSNPYDEGGQISNY